jgi:hypothetical protein
MKSIVVKKEIMELIENIGSEQAVADRLGITLRWVYYLKDGKSASYYLARAIRDELWAFTKERF